MKLTCPNCKTIIATKDIKKDTESLLKKTKTDWFSIDIALFIPLTKYFKEYDYIEEVKLGIGTFKTGFSNELIKTPYMATYSVDIKLKRLQRKK